MLTFLANNEKDDKLLNLITSDMNKTTATVLKLMGTTATGLDCLDGLLLQLSQRGKTFENTVSYQ
jgi:GTPase